MDSGDFRNDPYRAAREYEASQWRAFNAGKNPATGRRWSDDERGQKVRLTIWERAIGALIVINYRRPRSVAGQDVQINIDRVMDAVREVEIRCGYGGAEEQHWPARITLALEYLAIYLPNERTALALADDVLHQEARTDPFLDAERAGVDLRNALTKLLHAVRRWEMETP